MPLRKDVLTPAKRAKAMALAKELGADPKDVIAEIETMLAARTSKSGARPADKPKPGAEKPTAPAPEVEQAKLFMYHLPFVTVNEVRTKWLGLEGWSAEDGGDDTAAAFAAAFAGGAGTAVTADAIDGVHARLLERRIRRKKR